MQTLRNRCIAVGTLAAFVGATLAGPGTVAAQASSKTWRDIAIGAGVVTGYGLLRHHRNMAILGGVGTAYSLYRYSHARKREKRLAYRRTYYSSAPARYSSVSPYIYRSSSSSYRHRRYRHYTTYRHRRHHYAYHPSLHRRHYAYHPWLHRTHALAATRHHVVQNASLSTAKTTPATHKVALAAGAAGAGALTTAAFANRSTAAAPAARAPEPTTASTSQPMTANGTATSGIVPFGLGALLMLLGVGAGFGLAGALRRRPDDITRPTYIHSSGGPGNWTTR